MDGYPVFLFWRKHASKDLVAPVLSALPLSGAQSHLRCPDSICPETSRIFLKQVMRHYRNRSASSAAEPRERQVNSNDLPGARILKKKLTGDCRAISRDGYSCFFIPSSQSPMKAPAIKMMTRMMIPIKIPAAPAKTNGPGSKQERDDPEDDPEDDADDRPGI
jgi:hypothetical protein